MVYEFLQVCSGAVAGFGYCAPDRMYYAIGMRARTRRVTKSLLVRESLEKELHKPPRAGAISCYDLADDLAGTVKGLPKDLAENPKYMERFGR